MSCPTTGELIEHERLVLQHALGRDDKPIRFIVPEPTPGETLFRHSGWRDRRNVVHAALKVSCVSPARLQRFQCCGACAVVEYSPERKKYRTTAWYCRDRWCQPCANARAHELRRRILSIETKDRVRFVTLTLRHRPGTLIAELRRLRAAWLKLRKSKWFISRCDGGVAMTEIKLGTDGCWHVHLHCMIEGGWLPQRELSEQWHKATGDSHIVDVRAIDDPKKAIAYICKYVTKGLDASTFGNQPKLVEAIQALAGSRMWDAFGSWRKPIEENDGNEPDDWRGVCTVRELGIACHAGQQWAVDLVKILHRSPIEANKAEPDG